MRRLFLGISVILLLFSCSGHFVVRQINSKNISINTQTSPIDSVIQTVLKPYKDSLEHDMSEIIAVTATPLVKGKPESKLTNLMADIMLESGTEYCKRMNLPVIPDVSYVNYGGVRASLPQGNITVGHIFELMPFENELVLIRIKGESIRKMAEMIAARGGEGISGATIGIKNEKLITVKIGNKVVDPETSYWLATNDYVANGGDQMSMFLDPVERINTGLKIRDILIEYLEKRNKMYGIISVKEDGRIFNEQ